MWVAMSWQAMCSHLFDDLLEIAVVASWIFISVVSLPALPSASSSAYSGRTASVGANGMFVWMAIYL